MSWTQAQVDEFYRQRGEIPARSASDGEPKAPRHGKPKETRLAPVEGPLEWSITVYGHVPSKKSEWTRAANNSMFLPAEVKEQISALTTQILFGWRHPGPVEHPEITVKFYVAAARQDQDAQYTTIIDCLQAAGVLVNDNWAHNNGRKILEPCEFVKQPDERVDITIRKA